MGIRLSEHKSFEVSRTLDAVTFDAFVQLKSKSFNKNGFCFSVGFDKDYCQIKADYYIGLDWLGQSGRYLVVEPKLNVESAQHFSRALEVEDGTETLADMVSEAGGASSLGVELDYLRMFNEVLSVPNAPKLLEGILQVDWDAPEIAVPSRDDRLSPFLIVQFLNLLKSIVRKGLKKAYYMAEENLNSKIKGKILLSKHIKQNLFKAKLTDHYCRYQVFGENNVENRLLKQAFVFVQRYVENQGQNFFKGNAAILDMMAYCKPAFEHIDSEVNSNELKDIRVNPFFKEYKDATRLAQQILKRFGYNLSQTVLRQIPTPPFWIDMPRLFELYVYKKLLKANSKDASKVKYQFSTYGNSLDFLIKDGKHSMVIDAKYKMHYLHGQLHQDMRQVAGYARLTKVLNELAKNNEGFDPKEVLPCLIIYPDINKSEGVDFSIQKLIASDNIIKAYYNIYKLGISLPKIGEDWAFD